MWGPVRNWREHHITVQARRLVHECESLLVGYYARELQARRVPVPPWAWVSALAHSSEDQLVELARTDAGKRGPPDPAGRWETAVAFLAAELLSTADRCGCPVGDLQRQVVLPFELGTATSVTGALSINVAEFVRAVLEAFACFQDRSYPQ